MRVWVHRGKEGSARCRAQLPTLAPPGSGGLSPARQAPQPDPPPPFLPPEVAEALGVYTATDYCKIMEHLIQRWDVAHLTGLNPKAAEAQDFVCNLPARIRRLAERKAGELARRPERGPACPLVAPARQQACQVTTRIRGHTGGRIEQSGTAAARLPRPPPPRALQCARTRPRRTWSSSPGCTTAPWPSELAAG